MDDLELEKLYINLTQNVYCCLIINIEMSLQIKTTIICNVELCVDFKRTPKQWFLEVWQSSIITVSEFQNCI